MTNKEEMSIAEIVVEGLLVRHFFSREDVDAKTKEFLLIKESCVLMYGKALFEMISPNKLLILLRMQNLFEDDFIRGHPRLIELSAMDAVQDIIEHAQLEDRSTSFREAVMRIR